MKKDVFARARASNEALARRGAEGIRAAIGTEERARPRPPSNRMRAMATPSRTLPIAPAEGGALQDSGRKT